MNKIEIIQEYLPEIGFDVKDTKVSLLHPGHSRKEIYMADNGRQKIIIKFFKRYLRELFEQEIEHRYGNEMPYAPKLLSYYTRLHHTKPNERIQGNDFMFFVEEFINGKTLNELLDESINIYRDIYFIHKAIQVYHTVFDATYKNNFILKNANPNNIVFEGRNIKNPYIIDWTAVKNTKGTSKEALFIEYTNMVQKNISNIIFKHLQQDKQ